MGYESIKDIGKDLSSRFYQASANPRTKEHQRNYDLWQANVDAKKTKNNNVESLIDKRIEALRKGNYAEARRLQRQIRETAQVPTNRQEREEDYKKTRAGVELAFAGLFGYSQEEATHVYDRITNCKEMKEAQKEIDEGVDRFMRRMMA